MCIRSLLAHPLTRGCDPDDPVTTELRRRIIRSKPFLRRLYVEWYQALAATVPDDPRPALELGSGAGFMAEVVPGLITSEVFAGAAVDLVADARALPFAENSLRAILMVDVLHHVPDAEAFFHQAARCLMPGGVVAMVEPWVSAWSRLLYGHLHHEPFSPATEAWSFPPGGPLSAANQALPWIIFDRDRALFESRFPELEIAGVEPGVPLRYLLSGGISMRALSPAFTFGLWRAVETLLSPLNRQLAMFARITLRKRR